jgi:hypothetical protein
MAGDRRFRRDLVVGSGNYEIVHRGPGKKLRPLTRAIGLSSFKNDGSGESKLLAAIQSLKTIQSAGTIELKTIPQSTFKVQD